MTDNRANEPKQTKTKSSQDFVFTEAQVEEAAKAIADCHNPGMFERYPENWRVEARAALVAAQGAAPQAESEELAWYKVAAKHSADSMAEARATLQMFADRVDPFVFDELSSVLDDQPLDYETGDEIGEAVPALPSSGVDEDKLAEVIEMARDSSRKERDVLKESLGQYIARVLIERQAEWLGGGAR